MARRACTGAVCCNGPGKRSSSVRPLWPLTEQAGRFHGRRAGGLAPAQGQQPLRSLALLLLLALEQGAAQGQLSGGLAGLVTAGLVTEAGQGSGAIAQLRQGSGQLAAGRGAEVGSLETAGLADLAGRSRPARAPTGQVKGSL